MQSPLEAIIKKQIEQDGPMDIGQFMNVALGHPEHGYYMKQDPFGVGGDFTTAPEISQLFGEMIGFWVVDLWGQMGRPERLVLLECGPGRGTLMVDLLRATRKIPEFHEALSVHLLEMSPVLKQMQRVILGGYDVHWHEGLDSVPDDAPIIVVGNEFLDALPFRQLHRTLDGWAERVVVLKDNMLAFGLQKVPQSLLDRVPLSAKSAVGDVFEFSPARVGFVGGVAMRLKAQGGAALFIDYGHMFSGAGDSFQAVKGHEFVDVLSHVGDADLTSHVDFGVLKGEVLNHAVLSGLVTQGDFLSRLGVQQRAGVLLKQASGQQADAIEKGLHRLVDSDQMGTLFKVFGFHTHNVADITPAGF